MIIIVTQTIFSPFFQIKKKISTQQQKVHNILTQAYSFNPNDTKSRRKTKPFEPVKQLSFFPPLKRAIITEGAAHTRAALKTWLHVCLRTRVGVMRINTKLATLVHARDESNESITDMTEGLPFFPLLCPRVSGSGNYLPCVIIIRGVKSRYSCVAPL